MSKDNEKKIKNNEINIENENISGGCHGGGCFPGHGGKKHHPKNWTHGNPKGHWVWVPYDQKMMPPPPPGFEQKEPVNQEISPNTNVAPSPDSNSPTDSSSTGQ